MLVPDPRHLSRFACFDGTEEGRSVEWRFQLIAYLTAVDPQYAGETDEVARKAVLCVLAHLPPERRRQDSLPYAVLDHRGLYQEQATMGDHGNGKSRRTRGAPQT